MKVRSVLSVLAGFTMLFALHAGAQGTLVHPLPAPLRTSSPHRLTPEQIAKMPVKALPIRDFKLLSSGTGWVSTGDRLLFTADNGAHWKDISPPNAARLSAADSALLKNNYADVFFLNAETGWVSNYVANYEDDADFVVSSTVDGGANWTATKIKIPLGDPAQGAPELAGGGAIAFADKLHGWLLFTYQTGSAFSSAGLFASTDGGRTWHQSNDNPGFSGEIRAYPNGDLWATGGAGGNEALAVSHKGGGRL